MPSGEIVPREEVARRRPAAVLPAVPRWRRRPQLVVGGALTLGTILAVVIVVLAVTHP